MQKHHVEENKETPELRNTTNQNTSCAALENLIKKVNQCFNQLTLASEHKTCLRVPYADD